MTKKLSDSLGIEHNVEEVKGEIIEYVPVESGPEDQDEEIGRAHV